MNNGIDNFSKRCKLTRTHRCLMLTHLGSVASAQTTRSVQRLYIQFSHTQQGFHENMYCLIVPIGFCDMVMLTLVDVLGHSSQRLYVLM